MFATSVVFGRRACAALALSSAGLHAAMLGHASNVVAGGLLAAMIVACVYCARDLWQRGITAGLVRRRADEHRDDRGASARACAPPRRACGGGSAVDADGAGNRDRSGRGDRRDRSVVLPHTSRTAPRQRYTNPLSRRARPSRTAGIRPANPIAALRIGRAARGRVASRVSRSVIFTTPRAMGRRAAL